MKTRQPMTREHAWARYCQLLMEFDQLEAAVRDGRVSAVHGVSRLQALRAELEVYRDAIRACDKREENCNGA